MKKIFLHIIILLSVIPAVCQNYNNDWINYDQEYYRIKVNEDGIYRISYQTLVNNGFPADQIDPRWIQLFYQGKEQHIYIKGEGSNGIFDPNGYVEFYGKRNRGYKDTVLYDKPESCINPDYSLFSDTSVYFLTWNNSLNNKRMQSKNDTDFSSYSSYLSDNCIKHLRYNYTGKYYPAASKSIYTKSEGWIDAALISDNSNVNKNIKPDNLSKGSGNINIELAVAGAPATNIVSYVPHHLKVNLNGDLIIDSIYYGYDFVKKSFSYNSSQVSGDLNFVFSSNDVQATNLNDYNRVSYIDITYPGNYELNSDNSFLFKLPPENGSKTYLEITGFSASQSWLYDLDQNLRIKTSLQSGTLKALVPENGKTREMYLAGDDAYKSVLSVEPVSSDAKFKDYLTLNPAANYLIITHPDLINAAEPYKNYRNTTGFNASIFNINQLYDQYTFGLRKHPYAIRKLIEDYSLSAGTPPEYLFLLGKAIKINECRNSNSLYSRCLVPTFGHPPSDVMITSGMGNTNFEPFVPTGRLAARSEQHINTYLNKVKEYESNDPALWMKNIMHFGGGANDSEQTTFQSYLADYEEIIEDTLYGGKVHTFLKNSSAPIQITVSDSVRDLINNGVTMMNFFGHATASGFDQNIDDPENYENQGKYPFILANSCFSGDIHVTNNQSTSEKWVLKPNKGAIGFLATVSTGIPAYLDDFSDSFYKNLTYLNYGESAGKLQQEAIKYAQEGNLSDYRLENVCHEMTLHCDPALKLNHADKPDLEINNSDIILEDPEITTVKDSFRVTIRMYNPGMAFTDTFLVRVKRNFPDNSYQEYEKLVEGCLYKNEFTIKLPVIQEKAPGLNSISVRLDFYDQIDELSEMNNNAELSFLIKSGDIFPVYPFEFSIYPDAQVELKASTSDPFIGKTDIVFEMDTTDMFGSNGGSPLYSGEVEEKGGVVSWQPPVSLEENTVYYWRVAADHPNPDSIEWRESSFIHIPGEEGWSQAHFYQFKNDEFRFINYDRQQRDFDFIQTAKELHCHNIGTVGSGQYEDVRFSIDGAIGQGNGDGGSCTPTPAILVTVIDPVSLKAWPANIADYGQINYPKCSGMNRPNYFFVFPSGNNNSRDDMADFIINQVPDGYYILAYSFRTGRFENWSENQYSAYESIGATKIRNVSNNIPYIFFTKKGDISTTEEITGDNTNDEIDLYTDLFTAFNYGTIKSPVIGPSTEWKSFRWEQKQKPKENDNDSTFVEIIAYDKVNNKESVIDTIPAGQYNFPDLENIVNADNTPYLKLNFWSRDDSSKTPGQLKKWQIRHSGVPETAVNPQKGFYITDDTVKRGEKLEFAIATENISPYDMDSLLVKYWIQTSENNIIPLETKRLSDHPSGDVIIDTINCSTMDLSGLNSIWTEFNPLTGNGNYDQPEKYHFNNLSQYYFYVSVDNANPLLDVTFDGIHILDGDIVSAKPEIMITLKDENQYIPLNDTSLFRIYLIDMQNGNEKRIFFRDSMGNKNLEWTEGSTPDNKFKILYKPEFVKDGKYRLKVQAKDKAGNESGANDYSIDFEVITKSSITNVLNYPNPFSTSTRFVFELTGSVIPDKFRIEIYTVTGRLVKVIDKYELGDINIGRNITDYAWDGTDMYGDKLANGVYFYRIKTEIQGESVEHRSNESDKYFSKNIGKMYLIR